MAEPRLPSQGSAGGQARRGLGRGGSPDTRSAGLPRLEAPHSPARGTPGGASARMASLCSGIWSASRERHCPRRRATPVIGPREATRPSSNGSWQAFYQRCGSTSPPPRQCSREPTQERLNEPLPDNQITRYLSRHSMPYHGTAAWIATCAGTTRQGYGPGCGGRNT